MTKRLRRKPHDPAAAARLATERAEAADMIGVLSAQPSTALNYDPRTGKLVGAKRLTCFPSLLPSPSLELAAIDWLDELIRAANGENGGERSPGYISGSCEGAPGQNISSAMIAAGETLQAVESALYPACARLLFGLMKPDAATEHNWRSVVQSATGETNPQAQGAMVRAAAANLLWVQQNIDRLVSERVRRRREAA